jgi:hypothetical protein
MQKFYNPSLYIQFRRILLTTYEKKHFATSDYVYQFISK